MTDVHELAVEVAKLVAEQQAPPKLLDANGAAEMLNVPSSWVLAEARAGRIPCVRMGRYVRFRPIELAAWLDRKSR